MNSKTKHILLIFFLFIFLFLFLSISLFLFVYIFASQKVPQNDHPKDYKVMEFHPLQPSKKTQYRIGTLSQQLSDSQFLSYRSQTGNYVVISNFGGEELKTYKCTGTCYCRNHNDNERRSSLTVLTRGYRLIFTAITALVASEIAKRTFREECFLQIKSTDSDDPEEEEKDSGQPFRGCNKWDDIYIDEECMHEDYYDLQSEWVDDVEREKDFPDDKYQEYECKGTCVHDDWLEGYSSTDLRAKFAPFCEGLKGEKRIELMYYTQVQNSALNAQVQFNDEFFDQFCKSQSKMSQHFKNVEDSEITRHFKSKYESLCVGAVHSETVIREDSHLRNIKCVPVGENKGHFSKSPGFEHVVNWDVE